PARVRPWVQATGRSWYLRSQTLSTRRAGWGQGGRSGSVPPIPSGDRLGRPRQHRWPTRGRIAVVMGDRPDVETASLPIAAVDLVGLGATIGVALARVPFRDPFGGQGTLPHRLGVSVTREVLRS